MDASVFIGYAWADVPRAAMSVIVVAEDSNFIEKAGVGKTVDLVIGGKIDNVFTKPFEMES